MNSFQPVRPGVAKENEKKRPLTGQFDQENVCVTAMKAETKNEIGRCQRSWEPIGVPVVVSAKIKAGMQPSQATLEIAKAIHGR